MYKNIFAGYTGSQKSKKALERAFALAQENGATVTMAWVRDRLPANPLSTGDVDDEMNEMDEYFNELKAEARKMAVQYNVAVKCVCLKGNAANGIAKYTEKNGCDLIVVGQTERCGLLKKIFGTFADKVEKASHRKVLVA